MNLALIRNIEGNRETLSNLPNKFMEMVGKTWSRKDSEKTTLVRLTKDRKLWQAMIDHVLKKHISYKKKKYKFNTMVSCTIFFFLLGKS